MYIFLIVIHVLVCVFLILVILLQAGRGGGMSDMIGGGQPQSLFGTQTNAFMTRATEICAVLFVITSLSLGIISTQRGKSLIEKHRLVESLKRAMPAAPAAPSTAPNVPTTTPAHPGAPEVPSAPAVPAQSPAPKTVTSETAAPPTSEASK